MITSAVLRPRRESSVTIRVSESASVSGSDSAFDELVNFEILLTGIVQDLQLLVMQVLFIGRCSEIGDGLAQIWVFALKKR